MIRRAAYAHKGIRMTGEAVPVEYNEISVSRASRGVVQPNQQAKPLRKKP